MSLNRDEAPDLVIDATGLSCPLPLLKAKQGLNRLAPGQVLEISATDPGSVRDFHSFSDMTAHSIIHFDEKDGRYTYIIKKGGGQ